MRSNDDVPIILMILNLILMVGLYPRRVSILFLFGFLMWLIVLISSSCSTAKPKCTWVCEDSAAVPESCNCLEDLTGAR